MTVTFELNARSILRCLLAVVFIWAALSKLANLQDFYSSLVGYQLPLPLALLRLVATTLPWLELLCGLMLLSRFWLRAATLWALMLCAIFALATGQAWARGLQISCGCLNLDFLGQAAGHSPLVQALESVGFAFLRSLLLLAAAGFLLREGSPALRQPATAVTGAPDYT